MQTGYFNAAWQDIKNSPGWFGKIVVLSLVGLIPVFGWIVIAGYLYGWARDIAWNVHSPLPKRIFGNEDGRLYSRGFFVMVIGFVCMLVPWVLEMVWGFVMSAGTMWLGQGSNGGAFFVVGLSSMVVMLVITAVTFFAALFSWIGSMRMSVYGRLGAGFQFNRIWAMIRHDFVGLLRIIGMVLIMTFVMSIVLSIFLFILIMIGMFVGFMVAGGNMSMQASHPDATLWGVIIATGGVVLVLVVVYCLLAMIMGVFVEMMMVRALGYWTRQFDVPMWRGQDDPMPFELAQRSAQQPPYGQPPMQG